MKYQRNISRNPPSTEELRKSWLLPVLPPFPKMSSRVNSLSNFTFKFLSVVIRLNSRKELFQACIRSEVETTVDTQRSILRGNLLTSLQILSFHELSSRTIIFCLEKKKKKRKRKQKIIIQPFLYLCTNDFHKYLFNYDITR